MSNLFTLWQANGQQMSGILKSGDTVVFNGEYFSDADYFTKGKYYIVLEVEEIGMELETNYLAEEQFIYPDGLGSFDIAFSEKGETV